MSTLSTALRVPTRRNAELLMLIFAVLLVVAAEAAVEAAYDGTFSSRLITYAAVPIVIGVITHLLIRKVAPYADPLLLPIAVLLAPEATADAPPAVALVPLAVGAAALFPLT